MLREVQVDRSKRPPSVLRRQATRLANGALVIAFRDEHDRVVRETYYWAPDEARLAQILNRTDSDPPPAA